MSFGGAVEAEGKRGASSAEPRDSYSVLGCDGRGRAPSGHVIQDINTEIRAGLDKIQASLKSSKLGIALLIALGAVFALAGAFILTKLTVGAIVGGAVLIVAGLITGGLQIRSYRNLEEDPLPDDLFRKLLRLEDRAAALLRSEYGANRTTLSIPCDLYPTVSIDDIKKWLLFNAHKEVRKTISDGAKGSTKKIVPLSSDVMFEIDAMAQTIFQLEETYASEGQQKRQVTLGPQDTLRTAALRKIVEAEVAEVANEDVRKELQSTIRESWDKIKAMAVDPASSKEVSAAQVAHMIGHCPQLRSVSLGYAVTPIIIGTLKNKVERVTIREPHITLAVARALTRLPPSCTELNLNAALLTDQVKEVLSRTFKPNNNFTQWTRLPASARAR